MSALKVTPTQSLIPNTDQAPVCPSRSPRARIYGIVIIYSTVQYYNFQQFYQSAKVLSTHSSSSLGQCHISLLRASKPERKQLTTANVSFPMNHTCSSENMASYSPKHYVARPASTIHTRTSTLSFSCRFSRGLQAVVFL